MTAYRWGGPAMAMLIEVLILMKYDFEVWLNVDDQISTDRIGSVSKFDLHACCLPGNGPGHDQTHMA